MLKYLEKWPIALAFAIGATLSASIVLWVQKERIATLNTRIEGLREEPERDGSKPPVEVKAPSNQVIEYSATPAREHDSRWITDLATYLHDAALSAGHKRRDVMAVLVETMSFGHRTPELSIEIAPAQEEYRIESAHYFRRHVTGKEMSYVAVSHERVNRGHQLGRQAFQDKDVLLGIMVLHKANGGGSDFLHPSQLNTAFRITLR